MNLAHEAHVGELRKLREDVERFQQGYEAAMRIVRATYPDKFPDTYFICGEGGTKDDNNMPEKIMICPAYGCDFSYVYERRETTYES